MLNLRQPVRAGRRCGGGPTQTRVSRKSRRRYRLYTVIAILTVIAGLSGFYMGWRLFNAITSHRTASVESPAQGGTIAGPTPQASPGPSTGQPSPPSGPTVPTPGTVTFSPGASTIYSYQVAALDKERSALAEAVRWQSRGYPAYVTYLASSSPAYKVRIGAFGDKAVATAYGASLKKAGVSGFMTSVAIPSGSRTWRGSDVAYLGALKKAAEEVAGLVSAETGWLDAYYQHKLDLAALKTRADQWKERLRQAGQGLAAGAPADLASLGSRVGEALKAAETALDDLAAFAGGGPAEAYGKAVGACMKAVDAYRAVLAWDGNK
ncbi:MAG: SPOR domain-containing protein [Bacillota bacterium]